MYLNSTKDVDRGQVEDVLTLYDIGALVDMRDMAGGSLSTRYRLDTNRGRYLMRISEGRPFDDLLHERELLNYLHEGGVSVSPPMTNMAGGYFVPLQPGRFVSVAEYINGKGVGDWQVTAEHTAEVGRFLGQIHNHLKGFRSKRECTSDLGAIKEIMVDVEAGPTDSFIRKVLVELKKELARQERRGDDLPRGTIHGDLLLGNVLFLRGKLTAVMDFDLAAPGRLVFDVALSVMVWCFFRDKLVPERARALIQAYEEQRAISREERGALFDEARLAATRCILRAIRDSAGTRSAASSARQKEYRSYLRRLGHLKELGKQAFADALFS